MTSESSRRWPRRVLLLVTTVPFLVTVGVLAVLAVAYTLAGFFLVPRLITTYVPRYVQEQLKRRAEIGEVRVNPLLFKVEIKNFRLLEADGRPLLGFDRLFVDFELSSLFRRAWTFAEIQLEAPRVDAVLAQDGRLNIADLLDAFPKSEPEPRPAPPRRMVVQHAVVRGGTLSFTDLTGRQPQTAKVDPINVELHDITTLPEHRGPYVISATLNGGGVVSWDGDVSLVPLASTGRLGFHGFPLSTAWRFVQEDIALAEPAGKLDADVRYQLAYRDGATTLKVDGLDVTVAGLVLTHRGDSAPLLALETIRLAGGRGDLIARELTIPEISVSRGRLAATMGKDGTIDWQNLMVTPPADAAAPAAGASPAPPAGKPAAAPDARPWRVALDKVRVEQIALAFTDQRQAAPVEATVGDLTIGLSAKLESSPAGLAGAVEGLDVSVTGLSMTQRGDSAPLLALETIHLAGGRGDLATREVTVAELSVSRGRMAAIMARHGILNWQLLMAAPPAGVAAPTAGVSRTPPVVQPAATPAGPPWRLALDKVRVEKVALAFLDQSRAAPLDVSIGDLTVAFSAKLESGPAGLGGAVQDVGVKLARVAMKEAGAAKTPVISLDQIALEGGRIDLGKQQLAVSRVAVNGGSSTVVRAADGSLPLVTMLSPAEQAKPAAPAAVAPAASRRAPATASKPWTVALARFEFAGHRLAITDRSVTPPVQLDVTDVKASARDVRTDGKKLFPVEASFRITQGGRITIRGQVAPDGTAADAALTVAQLALTPAQPYVARSAAVALRSGDASTAGRFTYRAGRDRATVTYTGSFDIDGINVLEATSGDPVVAWKSLHADPLRFGLAPDRLEIGEVRLTGLDGKLEVFKDKSFSLAKLMNPSAAPAGAPPPSPAPPSPPPSRTAPAGSAPAGDAAPAFPVVVERVRIDDGSMSFADLSLVLPFATRVHTLNGVIVGLGSDPASRATVKLDGRVDEFGLVKVDGALSAYQPKTFTDIAVTFRNVPMSTLSPYSATFAGRRIRAGTLDLDLQYKIERSALAGENRVLLRQLQLGERVESPGAMRLPLDLAIAILSDSDGKIDIALPVRGNVDSPEFSYGHLIWQALVTVITKIATSPFRALGGLFGGDAESLQAIVFEPGSDAVQPPERQKLQRVAEVLGKRTRLKLTVHGGYEAKADGEALRSLHVRQDLAQRLEVKVKPGEDPGPVAFDQAKTQRALEALLNQRAGAKAVDEFEKGYEKSTGKKAQRVNPVLALAGRASPDRAFYEALFRRLVELAPLTDAEVTDLARRRGEAIARVLKERAGESAARVEVGAVEAAGGAERNTVPTRLELGAVGS